MKSFLILFTAVSSITAMAAEPRGASTRPAATPKATAASTAPAAPVLESQGSCGSSLLDEGPITLGFYAAEHSTARRTCSRTEVGLILGGGAEIDIPNFRAVMGGGATVFGSYALMPKLELFATLDAVHYVYAQNASPSASTLGMGQLSGGASYRVYESGPMAAAVSARLVLPTDFGVINAHQSAAEVGGVVTYRAMDTLEAHAFLNTGVTFALFTPAGAYPRASILFGAGASWSPVSAFAIALDVQSHYLDRATLDYVAPALGLRFKPSSSLYMELGVAVQLMGDRSLSLSPLRTQSVLGLRTAYRF